jgi:hypothetical protein
MQNGNNEAQLSVGARNRAEGKRQRGKVMIKEKEN